ncbi:MAG: molybdenum cofactor biosynthesis protein MoaE [Bordetella sp.]|nr:MAG: molybdenum cofactor biosynthesis protein MoaE [Bordetella sp.]
MISIQEEDFNPNLLQENLKKKVGEKAGAIVSFTGYVRDYRNDAEIQKLFLEHYPNMCERELNIIVNNAYQNWKLLDVVIVHRVGILYPGNRIVFVSTASIHRKEAFLSCEYILDMIKTCIPIWKCETLAEGSKFWVSPTSKDYTKRQLWNEKYTS